MRYLGAIVLGMVATAANGAATMYPVPKGASGVGHVVLAPGTAEQDHFVLDEKYPSTTAFAHYERLFAGWRPCYWSQRGWDRFGDVSGGRNEYIHQIARFWVSPKNDTSVMVTLRYTSPGSASRVEPAESRQFVVVLRHKVPNAETHLSEIEAKCEKAS